MTDFKFDSNSIIGAGGGCFRKGTQVQLQGGKTIAIEDLREGDEVLAFDERGDIHAAKVTKLHYHADPQPILRVKFWRGEVFITPNHWVLNQYGNFAEMGRLTTHDALVDGMGHLRPIISAEYIGDEPVWNLTVEPHHTFIANGIRVHNGGHRATHPEIIGSGGRGDKGGGRTPVEDPDSLQSRAMVSLLDLIGEGQIGGLVNGLQSIFLDDTPLQNSDGTLNFEGFTVDTRSGTQNQSVIPGFSDIESPQPIGVRCKYNLPVPVTITNPNVDGVRCIVSLGGLMSQDMTNGDIHGTTVAFRFELSTDGGEFVSLGDLSITGKTRSRYQRAYYYKLPKYRNDGGKASTWTIRMVRITPDSKSSSLNNDTYFDSLVEVVDSKLTYPNSALVGITIDSRQFSSIPSRSYLVDGLLIRVPSNYDAKNKTYSGVWDGTFKVAVSSNPAWVMFDLLTNSRYGLGQFIKEHQIDKAALYKIGRYCDERVPDGFGGEEPRFVINTVIASRADAYKVISELSSVFRGMAYWNGGMVGFMQDSPEDPVMIYNSANVVDGTFNYAGSARKDRHSVVNVSWNDPRSNYRQVIEYVEDGALIEKYGIRQLDVAAFGCTSRGQANRVGRWILYTEASESDVITFKVGIDSAFVAPGNIIKIHDPFRAGKRLGGRCCNATLTSVVLDSEIERDGRTRTISIRLPDGTFAERVLAGVEGDGKTVFWSNPLPAVPVDNAIWLIAEESLEPMLARVIGIQQDTDPGFVTIMAVEHVPSKFNAIEKGWKLELPKTSIINSAATPVISDLVAIEEQFMVAPGLMGLNLTASWRSEATSYEVTWWREGKYPTNRVKVMTSNPTLELQNVRAGVYHFNVVGISAFGKRSTVVTMSHQTQGRTAAPGDVLNFKVTKRTNDLVLTWDDVKDINVSGYEVRVGASWDAGEVITTAFAGTMITHDQSLAGKYFYHIRSINALGEFSDNVSTFELVLNSPATVEHFDIIQSGSRLELFWKSNPESDIAFYEVREGPSWNSGSLLSQTKATTLTIPSGGIGVRKFWIKAVASPGIYSELPAWIDTSVAMPTNSNVVVNYDEQLMAWNANKINCYVIGNDLMMSPNVTYAEYVFHVDLLDTYHAQNSVYLQMDSIVNDTDSTNWDVSTFDWDDTESERHWAPNGDIESVKGLVQISRKAPLPSNVIDGWSLDNSLTSERGNVATLADNATYRAARFTDGLYVKGGTKVEWQALSVPAEFAMSFWMKPTQVSDASLVPLIEFASTDETKMLRLAYDETGKELVLIDQAGVEVRLAFTMVSNSFYALMIAQTGTERKIFAHDMDSAAMKSVSAALPPVGAFSKMRLFWS